MPFAAAISEHPDAAAAIGECVGQLLDAHGPHPDLLAVFATSAHRQAFADMCGLARRLLRPACLMGAVSSAVLGVDREVEEQPALSVWAGWDLGEVAGVHLDRNVPVTRTDALRADEMTSSGSPDTGSPGSGWEQLDRLLPDGGRDRTLLLLADPLSFPVDDLLAGLTMSHPELVVVGGLCAPGMGPGAAALQVDDHAADRGAVAVVLDQRLDTVVSQGCRPVGAPFTVTRAEGNVLVELGSRPAMTRLQELALSLDAADRDLLARGVHLGRVVDERRADHGRGDFLIRAVLGARSANGGLVVGDRIEVGDTVQFQIRDAASAHEDLVELLQGHEAAGALVFTCNGRGTDLFREPDHDVRTVCELTGSNAVGGLFCAGEIGPIGSRSFLHGFTASVALFQERSART